MILCAPTRIFDGSLCTEALILWSVMFLLSPNLINLWSMVVISCLQRDLWPVITVDLGVRAAFCARTILATERKSSVHTSHARSELWRVLQDESGVIFAPVCLIPSNPVREWERPRDRDRETNGEQRRVGVGRVGTIAAVNSRDKNRLEKPSSRAGCTFGTFFFLQQARCTIAWVRLRWRRRRRLFAVGENLLFST